MIEKVKEPAGENRVIVDEKIAVFDGIRNPRIINRFGGMTVKPRRCYKYLNHKGGYYPLDEKKRHESCELMVVEMDGTMNTQIHEEQGVTGRQT